MDADAECVNGSLSIDEFILLPTSSALAVFIKLAVSSPCFNLAAGPVRLAVNPFLLLFRPCPQYKNRMTIIAISVDAARTMPRRMKSSLA
jgi:hypothetical protein